MKTANELGLTPTQRKNLAKLTVYVRDKAEPPRFNINWFFRSEKNGRDHYALNICPSIKEYECGTTACFLGYGIPAGIKARKQEMWRDYSKRAFGINMYSGNPPEYSSDAYNFLFAEDHKNSKDAAALRGAWFLMNGLPHDTEVQGLCYWETPSDFEPDWDAIEAIAKR
jgi:hypothetical protein